MAPVQLNCPTVECDYKTQALKFDQAEKILDKHREDVHHPAAVASLKYEGEDKPSQWRSLRQSG